MSIPMIRRNGITTALLTAALLCAALPAAARVALWASGEATAVPVGKAGASKQYLLVGPADLMIPLEGPGEIVGYTKVHYAPGEAGGKTAALRFAGLPGAPAELPFDFEAPKRGSYGDGRPGLPSSGKKFALSVPAGAHELRLAGEVASGGELFVILYYDGPPQPGGLAPPVPVAAAKPATKKMGGLLGFKWKSSAGLKFTYDNNAFKYSQAFANEYFSGSLATREKYQNVDRFDDLVISPSLSLEARRRFFALGETRIGLKYARTQYWHNEILANEEYRLVVRQNTGKGKSIELYYSYSPSKYLRQLNDRPPDVSSNTPVTSEQFRLTRNNAVATWRQKHSKALSSKLTLTRQLYYYNKPHLENDLLTLELRGTLYWTLARPWRLTVDYAFKDANGRGIDVEGQTLTTSPASDGTHKKNMYQVELRWKPPYKNVKRLFASVSARARYAVSYFSADGTQTIADDPYHVGRQDNEYAYRIEASRKLPYGVSGKFGFQYAERDVDSPWWGDIKEDKNWIQRTWWFAMSYKLF